MKYLYSLILVLWMATTAVAQPQTRSVDYRLLGGQVFDTATNTPIGNYSLGSLEMPRGSRSKILVAIVSTGWGDSFLFTVTINVPSRDEWTRGPIMSLPGSFWAPLGVICLTRQEDGGYWRLTTRAYLIGGEINGDQKETPSQDPSGSNEGAGSKDTYQMSPLQEMVSAGSKSFLLERRGWRHWLARRNRVQYLDDIFERFGCSRMSGRKLKLRD